MLSTKKNGLSIVDLSVRYFLPWTTSIKSWAALCIVITVLLASCPLENLQGWHWTFLQFLHPAAIVWLAISEFRMLRTCIVLALLVAIIASFGSSHGWQWDFTVVPCLVFAVTWCSLPLWRISLTNQNTTHRAIEFPFAKSRTVSFVLIALSTLGLAWISTPTSESINHCRDMLRFAVVDAQFPLFAWWLVSSGKHRIVVFLSLAVVNQVFMIAIVWSRSPSDPLQIFAMTSWPMMLGDSIALVVSFSAAGAIAAALGDRIVVRHIAPSSILSQRLVAFLACTTVLVSTLVAPRLVHKRMQLDIGVFRFELVKGASVYEVEVRVNAEVLARNYARGGLLKKCTGKHAATKDALHREFDKLDNLDFMHCMKRQTTTAVKSVYPGLAFETIYLSQLKITERERLPGQEVE